MFNQFQQFPRINQQQMNMIKSLMGNKNMSAEQMVRSICKERGIDVDSFMKQFEDFAKSK